MKIPIALQLYSVRRQCAEDLLGVISEVGAMGYDGVEFAGYHGHSGESIRRALDDAGLKCEGTHTGVSQFDPENFNATVEMHQALGTKFAIIPGIPENERNSVDACLRTAERMRGICERLKPHGIQTGFHAHAGDMTPLENGKCAWDIFAEETPAEFILQYDTANGMAGGADPVKPILDWPGRNLSVHLKEWTGNHGAVIGEGDVPWQQVFEACENGGGVQWYVVEHEEESEMSPMDAVRKCLQNLRAMGK